MIIFTVFNKIREAWLDIRSQSSLGELLAEMLVLCGAIATMWFTFWVIGHLMWT